MKKLAFAVSVTSGAVALFSHHNAEASTQHTVQSGESLWSISQKYNISVDSIKKNNNISNNIIFPGQVLTIGGSNASTPSSNTTPTSSSVYTVKSGDSLYLIANKFNVSVDSLMKANNLSGYLIKPNQQLKIPSGSKTVSSGNKTVSTPIAPKTSSSNNGSKKYTTPKYSHQNLYTAGQCTWYVFDRRAKAGLPISTYWSDAKYWASNAAQAGYTVNHVATVGSIMQTTVGYYGHVAYVERVNADGSILVSEMNYLNGPYNTNTRIIPASAVSSYNYIH
ncbi:LysM peptidoglycan-binding domain-containing protein [Staphylococcus sp. NRL 16/872]|uniref:LysM peptidoglycan-binding domain-containing protein n=1 Tax=Staphylococcus sp. NRL 16/872 TaxID=2930131 RepID=UPI001FB24C36|nr:MULTISPECIES: LysM peptidoglycan-binding domain-containing protein [unclassified Staphylococcus]MCJ1656975.1 LysM peptidoglycan-binding domain-containing protein [Staphylococcus sp. NRL 21/187]MCJ1662723.1 LysM peptidoglycan-binding domain-containing protein [Staphylococcus sp. NRL 18/288]MCJ1668830.1 LysM peptidoglycan-binding domain-containing protein [Staphylococcus sp. NRL 19/737]WEN69047.1 LysM peptidoglycan-binding domain-containing protein [Staphylococcus sp. NRL 16/872]